MKRRVVVTGLGMVSPLGVKVEENWTRVVNGESGIRPITLFDATGYSVRIAGEVPNWTTDGYVAPKDVKRLDRFVQFGLIASIDAVRDSGLDFSKEDVFRCGACIGTGIGGLLEIEIQHRRLLERGPDRVSAFTIPKLMPNAASGHVSIEYGLRGPSQSVSTACASATNAIGDAFRMIQHDEVEVMVCGGTEAAVTTLGLSAFAALKALSERNDDPTAASRPFDADRDGFVLSEGAGVIVIEELEHAKRRGARIYCELLGYGSSSDGSHITQPDKDGIGASHAMRLAINDARRDVADIGYINAHGTSTPLGDQAETQAIKNVFGEHARTVSVSSTKSQLGHLLGASGGVEIVLTILAMGRGVIPPTINLNTPDPVCDLDYTPNTARQRKFVNAMSNSFGFGGHNGSLVVGELRDA